jgi:hypothetical protein
MNIEAIKQVFAAMKEHDVALFEYKDVTGETMRIVASDAEDTETVSTDAKGVAMGFTPDEEVEQSIYKHKSLRLKDFSN